jgi:hypothetical protein
MQVVQFYVCVLYGAKNGEFIWYYKNVFYLFHRGIRVFYLLIIKLMNLCVCVCVWKKNTQLHTFREFMKVSAYKETVWIKKDKFS